MCNQRIQAKQSQTRQTTHAHSHKYNCSAILESDLELDYFNWRCYQGNFKYFKMQAEKLRYLSSDGKFHHFTADAELIDSINTSYVDEVKYVVDAEKPDVKHVHELVAKAYASEGTIFRVMTEIEIRIGHRPENLRTLAPTWAWPSPDEEFSRLTDQLEFNEASIKHLHQTVNSLGFATCLITRAIGHNLINCDITQPWDDLQLDW